MMIFAGPSNPFTYRYDIQRIYVPRSAPYATILPWETIVYDVPYGEVASIIQADIRKFNDLEVSSHSIALYQHIRVTPV
jgi:hypothetical protein